MNELALQIIINSIFLSFICSVSLIRAIPLWYSVYNVQYLAAYILFYTRWNESLSTTLTNE